MSDIVALVIPFFGLIVVGVVAGRLVRAPMDALQWMNVFIIYIALPALFFQLLSATPIERLTEWRYILGAVAATYLVYVTMFVIAKWRSSLPEATIAALAAAYGNIGYMGPGLALLAFGEDAAVPVALIFCFENVIHFAVVPLLMGLSGKGEAKGRDLVLQIVRQIAFHPFIIATALGVAAAATSARVPVAIDRLLDYLAAAAAPCALFVMGVTLALRPVRRMTAEIGIVTVLKLFVHPVLCWMMLSWIGNFDPVWVATAVLLAGLPTATNVFVLGTQYGSWVERASATILVTTTLSIATLTALLVIIRGGYLPADLIP